MCKASYKNSLFAATRATFLPWAELTRSLLQRRQAELTRSLVTVREQSYDALCDGARRQS